MKLNIGSGKSKLKGYINLDITDKHYTPDVLISDVTKLPYGDNTADEIRCDSSFEHFWRWEQQPALREFWRVLKPGGVLVINWVPHFDNIIKHYQEGTIDLDKLVQFIQGPMCYDRIYGIEQLHKDLFSEEHLRLMLSKVFDKVEVYPQVYENEGYAFNIGARCVK